MSLLALFVSVILIAQTAITINNYNKTSQGKDLNYYWSWVVMIISIITAICSIFGMVVYRGNAIQAAQGLKTAVMSGGTPVPSAAAIAAEAEAAAKFEQAQAALKATVPVAPK
jgi:hypothetical protein